MKENYSGGTKGSMQEGMTKKSVPSTDESMKCKGGSVNDNATRTGVAPTPKTLGPRADG
jgi:hypothetical protein